MPSGPASASGVRAQDGALDRRRSRTSCSTTRPRSRDLEAIVHPRVRELSRRRWPRPRRRRAVRGARGHQARREEAWPSAATRSGSSTVPADSSGSGSSTGAWPLGHRPAAGRPGAHPRARLAAHADRVIDTRGTVDQTRSWSRTPWPRRSRGRSTSCPSGRWSDERRDAPDRAPGRSRPSASGGGQPDGDVLCGWRAHRPLPGARDAERRPRGLGRLRDAAARAHPTGTGISWLPDGTSLRAAVAADPVGWLGGALAARWGGSTGVLVKLLDAGSGCRSTAIPVDPSRPSTSHRRSARPRAGSCSTTPPRARSGWAGRRTCPRTGCAGWIETQDAEAMLAVMNRFPAGPGRRVPRARRRPACHRPGRVHHRAPGADRVLASSRSTPGSGSMPTGPPWAWAGRRHSARSTAPRGRASARRASGRGPRRFRDDAGARVERLFPESTAGFFQALRVRVHDRYELPAGFSVLVIESGAGELAFGGGELTVRKGETLGRAQRRRTRARRGRGAPPRLPAARP